MFHAWKEGMDKWLRVFEIDELKHLLTEITHEISELQHDHQQLKKKKEKDIEEEQSEKEEKEEGEEEVKSDTFIDSDVCYYSKQEKLYKLFDPIAKTWTGQKARPSAERLQELHSQLKASSADDIAKQAAEEALKKIASDEQ